LRHSIRREFRQCPDSSLFEASKPSGLISVSSLLEEHIDTFEYKLIVTLTITQQKNHSRVREELSK
jgi:hypothetical protein